MSEAVQGSTVVEADVDMIFEVVAGFEAYPEWQPEIKQVEVLETDDDGRGSRVRYVVDAGVFKATMVLEYSYTDTSMSWVLVDGDTVRRNDGRYTFADQGDGTTLVTYELEVEPAVPLPAMLRRRAAQRIIDAALSGMKQRAEARA